MMMMVKQARSVYGHSIDNQIDAAGYAALAAMLDPMADLEDDITKEFMPKERVNEIQSIRE